MARVSLEHVVKEYGAIAVVDGVDLQIRQGEFFSLLGPSGSGKTTTLRMIAGFVDPTSGSIRIQGQDIVGIPPEKRDIGFVFQNYAIFPHKNVFENIAFGLRMRRMSAPDIQERVDRALEQVGLVGYEGRYQQELSGGEMQRVALARVLVTEPRILLLDEPLSALDRKLRDEMRLWLKDLQRQLKITSIYVTHDQSEALILSDRVAVMNKGRIEQVDTPQRIYEQPRTHFVAEFLGQENAITGRVAGIQGGYATLEWEGRSFRAPVRDGISPGDTVTLVVRPENILVDEEPVRGDFNSLSGVVASQAYEGANTRYRLSLEGGSSLIADVPNRPGGQALPEGTRVEARWYPQSCTILAG
jgi:putative spermidine/putrescine transport system ATP-binding protein